MLNISVMVSGSGSNLQAVIDGVESGQIKEAKIVQVISSSPKAFALERARNHGIKTVTVSKADFPEQAKRAGAILNALQQEETDLVVLAGYMNILGPEIVEAYRGRIINIHPSLIPAFCGEGFYGMRVHEAVIQSGAEKSGATVHFVDEGVDTGEIILQEEVAVRPGDSAEMLAMRVLNIEHKILPMAINKWREKGEK